MKVYIATRFKGAENKPEIDALCRAVKQSGMEDFSFVRDIENYQKTFTATAKLWECAKREINACDAFLIDLSDAPTGGRVVEAGIAYALGKPIFVTVKNGVSYKDLYNGIATLVIRYEDHSDITRMLVDYLSGLRRSSLLP